MFNTDQWQSQPDYVLQETEVIKNNTNKRYRFFRQMHFTAGDYEQFLQLWDRTNPVRMPPHVYQILHSIHPNCKLPLYTNLNVSDVFHTFAYIFNKFKKGIFLKIVDGKPKVFLPFSKVDFKNEWYSSIRVNPKYINIVGLMRHIAYMENRDFQESRIHKDIRSWYGNNGLVRLEYPISEGDSGVNMLRDMFVCLIQEREVPSCELFINKRDFPILKKDGTEAYDSFFGKNTPVIGQRRNTYAPVLSMTTSEEHADIPIPTWEDWCRVSYQEGGKMFRKEFRRFPSQQDLDAIPWASKKATAVFRGASTGLGTTLETNPRLYFSWLSHQGKKDIDGTPFLDVGITKWNLRPRKSPTSPYLDTINIHDLPFSVIPRMDTLQQARYKYILHLPGHSAAYRLSMELTMGSVVLLYPCPWKLWYSDMLQPFVHYVPIDPTDPRDIYNKIIWCKENDDKCQDIVANAKVFADKYLSRKAILDYLQDTLWTLYRQTGPILHVSVSTTDIIHRHERMFMDSYEKNDYTVPPPMKEYFMRILKEQKCDRLSHHLMTILCRNVDMTQHVTPVQELKHKKVYVIDFGGRKMLKKEVSDPHETSVGYMQMNLLSQTIPHFVYTFHHDNGCIYTDYIQGKTLEDVLNDPSTTVKDILYILQIVCLAIQHAQQQCGFMHMDLYPWNIIIRTLDTPTTIVYNMGGGVAMQVVTTCVPVFIDYGRSHVVYEGKHFYNVVPFRLCAIQDIVSIVFSSFHIYLARFKLSLQDVGLVLNVMRFFSESSYVKKDNVRTISALKMFLKEKKKFSNMLMDDKAGLHHLYPLDFFKHVSHLCPDGRFCVCAPDTGVDVGRLAMMPFLFHSLVVQTLFLEVVALFGLDIPLFLRSATLHANKVIDQLGKEPESPLRNLRLLVAQWCLERVTGESHPPMPFQPKEVEIPPEQSLYILPLIASHPFQEDAQDPFPTHCTQMDWYECFVLMFMHKMKNDSFLMWTRCFRNYTFHEWKK